MKWIFLFFISFLGATVNQPLRCEFFSGYRNDRIHWHLQDAGEGGTLLYTQLYRDVEFWENGLTFKAIYRDLTFFLRGAYSTFGKGTLYQRIPGSPSLQSNTSGWAADGVGYFGYSINLTADRTYKVILTPLLGYSGYFECLHTSPGVFRQVWNGVFLGGGFLIEPVGRLVFNAGYTYHFMHNQLDSTAYQTIHESSGGNKGHTGWLQMDYKLRPLWRIGIGGQIHYFFSRVVDATIEQTNLSQKLKLRWTSVSAGAQISREF